MIDELIGKQYLTRGKYPKLYTVRDKYSTYNMNGDLVKTRYMAEQVFLGQLIQDVDVCKTTILMGIDSLKNTQNNKKGA